MLTVAGGLHLDGNVSRAHADKVELEGPSLSLAGFQHVTNPGYDESRGPVSIGTVRMHVDF